MIVKDKLTGNTLETENIKIIESWKGNPDRFAEVKPKATKKS